MISPNEKNDYYTIHTQEEFIKRMMLGTPLKPNITNYIL